MQKMFVLVLVALLLGVGIVALIETDPGYVLIAYGNYTIEASLWVGLLVLALVVVLVYLPISLIRKALGGQRSFIGWMGTRKARQAARQTTRGFISFIEGNWAKSRRQLLAAAASNEVPLLNYLVAARASYRLNELDKMREYLGAAEDSESEAGIAVELTQAELKLHNGQYEQALATLVRARRNAGRHPYVLSLLHKVYLGLRDWNNLADLLPELKKYKVLPQDQLLELERSVHLQLLSAGARANGDSASSALQAQWHKLPAPLRKDSELIQSYVELSIEQGQYGVAEKTILHSLKQNWNSTLVHAFGLIESDNASRQLAQAESWLAAHEADAELFLCLGRLAARNKLWGKARDYFESSYKLEKTTEVCAELGRLLISLGEPKVSAAYFQRGLLLHESRLPELPMPEQVTPHTRRLG